MMRRPHHLTIGVVATIVMTVVVLASAAAAWVYDHYPYYEWAPMVGYLQVVDQPFRYAYNDLNWNDRVPQFFYDPNQNGYDHENWFYDYCDSYGGCAFAPSAQTFFTNLPGPHDLDNNYANPQYEVGIELDTFHADLIQTNTWYYVDFRLNQGSSWSRVKLRTARVATDLTCNAWWCATEWDGEIIVYYGDYVAPGDNRYWTNY